MKTKTLALTIFAVAMVAYYLDGFHLPHTGMTYFIAWQPMAFVLLKFADRFGVVRGQAVFND